MDQDDDDGVGYIADSHYIQSVDRQAVPLLKLPSRSDRDTSISSNVSDMDVPIYSADNLTTKRPRADQGVSLKQLSPHRSHKNF